MIQIVEIAFKFLVLDGFSRRLFDEPNTILLRPGRPCFYGGIRAAELDCPVRSLVRKLPQLVGLLVPQLPICPRFSILEIVFPLSGIVRILLQSEDGFFVVRRVSSDRGRLDLSPE